MRPTMRHKPCGVSLDGELTAGRNHERLGADLGGPQLLDAVVAHYHQALL